MFVETPYPTTITIFLQTVYHLPNQILDIRKNLFIIFCHYVWAFIWFKGRFLYEGVTIAKVVA